MGNQQQLQVFKQLQIVQQPQSVLHRQAVQQPRVSSLSSSNSAAIDISATVVDVPVSVEDVPVSVEYVPISVEGENVPTSVDSTTNKQNFRTANNTKCVAVFVWRESTKS